MPCTSMMSSGALNGPFRAPEDIVLVQGIGERVLEDNRDNIIVSAPEKPE
jgi:DNA uptake protein ComE-like DNA-binding protein